jgi:predicted DNA-binding transcriptional regulator AlpA
MSKTDLFNPHDSTDEQTAASPASGSGGIECGAKNPLKKTPKIKKHRGDAASKVASVQAQNLSLQLVPPEVPVENDAHLSVRLVAKRFGVSVATIWRWVQNRTDFPKPRRLTRGTTRWLLSEIVRFERRQGEVSR